MAFPPELERNLETSVRQARLVAFTCCFLAPVTYIASFGSQVLRGHWQLYLAGFGSLPWSDTRLPGSLAVALGALALAFLLPPKTGRLKGGSASLATLRGRNLLTCGLLVGSAAAGLFLGTRLGPPVASLCLCLFLAPMVAGWFVFPTAKRWRGMLEV
jgi:hypothetical protein